MTHWTPQRLHFSEVLFIIYLLIKQQLEKVAPKQFIVGTHFAKIAIIQTTKGKD